MYHSYLSSVRLSVSFTSVAKVDIPVLEELIASLPLLVGRVTRVSKSPDRRLCCVCPPTQLAALLSLLSISDGNSTLGP